MPFGNITVGSLIYVPRQPGVYVKQGLTFADPMSEFRIRGASVDKNGKRTGNITFVDQKDVVVSGNTFRKQATTSFTAIFDDGPWFTPADFDQYATNIATFLTSDTVGRWLSGEQ